MNTEQEQPETPRKQEKPRETAHILVVDDEESVANVVRAILCDAGFDVVALYSGAEAVEYCLHNPVDLLLLDICMPEMDGFEVCRQLKKSERTQNIPIVLQSALSEPEHKIEGFSLGVFDYVTKPFRNEEIVARVSNILARQRIMRQAVESSRVDTLRQLSVTLADRITNPLSDIMAGCQILSNNLNNPRKVFETAEMIKTSVDQIYDVLVRLSYAKDAPSTEYVMGISMIDLDQLESDVTQDGPEDKNKTG